MYSRQIAVGVVEVLMRWYIAFSKFVRPIQSVNYLVVPQFA